ncbi:MULTISPECIES: hypothetical protein [unclassified Devosia]|uniref:hypothetical protein n=1 Tax=unclassified Devosia TaxID=196773 RepID=UPI0015F9E682|nr:MULTISPECIES: hypothetical protein [unclassified Devosia]MBJ6989143.1 hypothetical protein [Devosia sp. MC521]MBJ7578569.1 hypothetical protein [Devosia sp. MC532]QMW61981.1 hypothetical protein H4N61_13615 [Devosia sp. MC521]
MHFTIGKVEAVAAGGAGFGQRGRSDTCGAVAATLVVAGYPTPVAVAAALLMRSV